MPLQATLFSRLLQQLPWAVFDRAVAEHRMDDGYRILDARSHLVALMAGQLIEANGLRDIEAVLAAHAPALARRRIEPACRSTLADANKLRTPEAFEAIIPALLAELSPTQRRRTKNDLRLIDSTVIHPGRGAEGWAHFQNGKVAAKVHVVYDPKAQVPTFYELTSGNTNDITVAKAAVPIEAGVTYVFDLGYYDFKFWADLHQAGCTLITRLKRNTPVTEIERHPAPSGTNVLSDRIISLPKRLARSRKNPFSDRGREIVVRIQTGKTIALFTNDLLSPAAKIADLYKTRWEIELFFRWIKQNLRVRKYIGTSKNAVRIQTAIAMLSYIILTIVHLRTGFTMNVQIFTAIVRQNLFHRTTVRQIIERLKTKTIPHIAEKQLKMAFA